MLKVCKYCHGVGFSIVNDIKIECGICDFHGDEEFNMQLLFSQEDKMNKILERYEREDHEKWFMDQRDSYREIK